MVDRLIRGIGALSRVAGIAAALCLVLAVGVVCEMVFVRYLLGRSTVWQTEFTTYALVAAVFLGSPYVLLTRGHVSVDLLPLFAGPRLRRLLALLAALVSLAFCLVIAYHSVLLWHEAYSAGWTSDTVWAVALWKPYLAMAAGMVLLCLQYVAEILALVTGRGGSLPGEEAGPAP